ncbi:MAG: hypothetical protein A2812_01525 [Candidatus Staskawiczbacteria bacterium RIFCSPHIGHO2_01_FULL_36_16]|uniref:Prepilin-type N-terminal cleavage/methylation domain-containing protein n=2 Tax=Candidatus Staskawicziibacteriota TaxID=1817916 RepID=A0A1G2HKT5_9BACT|nr:MAG: hypothetical protein A2812_01525 [Candidatus Staskawiczbacteria bacterium RIFCSPHIGHO2_01_FULL_36_16]
MMLKNNKNKGFTLIELIISIAVFAVLMFVVVGLFLKVFSNPEKNLMAIEVIDQGRIAASVFSNEIRNAATGNDGSYPLNQAGDSQIIFYSNYNSAGTAVNRIRYYFLNNNLYKGVIVPSGDPLSYNPAFETITALLTDLKNESEPVFYYYDGDYGGSSDPLSQPINLNEVKFIKINLILPRHSTESNDAVFLIDSGAAIRNLKDNLGN